MSEIRKALEAAQPEPVGEWTLGRGGYPHLKWTPGYVAKIGQKLYAAPSDQPEQEPVGEVRREHYTINKRDIGFDKAVIYEGAKVNCGDKLYLAAPSAQPEPLNEEEERKAFNAWCESLPGHPFYGALTTLMRKAWLAAIERSCCGGKQ